MAPATGAVVVGVIAVARHGAQTAEGLHPFDLRAQRLGEIVGHARVVRDRPAIPHQDHEGLEDVSVLVAHVLSEIEVRLARERRAQVRGDQYRKPPRRACRYRPRDTVGHPDKEEPLRCEHQREKGDQPQRNPPVQAPVPHALRHLPLCTRFPTRSGSRPDLPDPPRFSSSTA